MIPLSTFYRALDAFDQILNTCVKVVGGIASPRLASNEGVLTAEQFNTENDLRLTRAELLSASNLTEDQLVEIESYGLITIRGRHYDSDALAVASSSMEALAIARPVRSVTAV